MSLIVKVKLNRTGLEPGSLKLETRGVDGAACLAITAEMRDRLGLGFTPTEEMLEVPNGAEILVDA